MGPVSSTKLVSMDTPCAGVWLANRLVDWTIWISLTSSGALGSPMGQKMCHCPRSNVLQKLHFPKSQFLSRCHCSIAKCPRSSFLKQTHLLNCQCPHAKTKGLLCLAASSQLSSWPLAANFPRLLIISIVITCPESNLRKMPWVSRLLGMSTNTWW